MLAGALPVLDGDGDRSFASSFTTLTSFKEMPKADVFVELTGRNHAAAFALVTAQNELRPECFGVA